MSHTHNIIDSDNRFVIDATTRVVISNGYEKLSLMQHDHNSERLSFSAPRYIEGHDLSLCDKVEVLFSNRSASMKSEGKYPVKDLTVNPDNDSEILFSWLVSKNATKYPGTLKFNVRFTCLDGYLVTYCWNSDVNHTLSILEGATVGNDVITETPSKVKDIVERTITKLYSEDIDKVTVIGSNAFYGCTALEFAELPDTVTAIGANAFNGCTALESVHIPEGVLEIGANAFYGCAVLNGVTLPESITSIGSSAFSGCKALESIIVPDNVTVISSSCFYGCSNLKSITLPGGITEIGVSAIIDCTSLTDIYFGGTKTQWGYVKKLETFIPWDNNTGEYTIHCTDGDIAKS